MASRGEAPYGRWAVTIPPVVARSAELFRSFPAEWALCGGWAVDAWLGRVSRDHADVDLTVWHDDQRVVYDTFRDGWLLNGHDPDDDDGIAPWTGRVLGLPAHIHAYSDDGDNLDIQLNRRVQGSWVLSADAGMTLPVERCIAVSPWGLPTVIPPVVLFYKASETLRPHDRADFGLLAPLLSPEDRSWLREAIAALAPGHDWLTSLSDQVAPTHW